MDGQLGGMLSIALGSASMGETQPHYDKDEHARMPGAATPSAPMTGRDMRSIQ